MSKTIQNARKSKDSRTQERNTPTSSPENQRLLLEMLIIPSDLDPGPLTSEKLNNSKRTMNLSRLTSKIYSDSNP
jgi:hypothetical protein